MSALPVRRRQPRTLGRRRATHRLSGLVAVACCLAMLGCDAAPVRAGMVVIATHPWVGSEANAAVVATILQTELNYTVRIKRVTAAQSWPALASGEIDVILENWGHQQEKRTYIDERSVAVSAGANGNKGVVGWYLPIWMVQEYPGIQDWRNLNRYSHLFATGESGGRGRLLESDPSFATNDRALVANLNLNYTVEYSGSEQATIEAARFATRHRQPLLFYFWQPHFLFLESRFAKVNLPEYQPGCDANPSTVACDYPVENLDKIVSRRFANSGGRAYQLVRNFVWTNADQDAVAEDLAVDRLSPRAAADHWLRTFPLFWEPWLPD